MRRKLKVLLVFDCPYAVPRGYEFKEEFKDFNWDAERYTRNALKELGHEVTMLGIHDDINILLEEIKENRPDLIFNLIEVFNNQSRLEKNMAALIEMLDIPYTGALPATLFICNNKALSKERLTFHKIKVPHFYTYYKGHKVWLPKKLNLPLIVKPLTEEASRGISQASIVDSEEALIERVRFIHENMNMDAIAEEYIDGREFYVSVIGSKRIQVLPVREVKFGQLPEDEPRIATYKAKWDYDYRERWGIKYVFVGRLPEGWEKKIVETCKRAYRALNMRSYARFDIRVTPQAQVYIIEANANPNLDKDDEVGQSAEKAGISYTELIKKIVSLAFQRRE
ncbi:MAG: ATP-grasp domain-containing protein [Candidatus Omnitrophota bacterium]|nr:MAG: ATP-grasp domain-containing protein [Candidatus Omnitrophota bacterium]